MYREQRGNERIRRSADVHIWPYLEDDPSMLEPEAKGRLIDVSKGGLCVEVPVALAKGRRVNLKMNIETVTLMSTLNVPFVVDTTVRWCKEVKPDVHQLGLQFEKLSKVQADQWASFMGRWRTTLL